MRATQLSKGSTPLPDKLNEIAKAVVNSAFDVHCRLGPGLLESVYEACLAHEIRR